MTTRATRTTKLDLQDTLKLAQDLRAGDGPPGFVFLNNRWLLVDLLRNVLLGQLKLLTSRLHSLGGESDVSETRGR